MGSRYSGESKPREDKQGKRVMRIKIIFVWLFPIITLLNGSCCSDDKSYYKYIINLEDQIKQDNENVLFAKILYDEGLGFWGEKRLYMSITFRDNQWMVLGEVGYSHSDIKIISINGYAILRYIKNLNNGKVIISSRFPTGLTGKDTDGIISNINHIIKDFDTMAAYVEGLEDIDSDKGKFKDKHFDFDWLWSDEAGMEKKITETYEQIDFKSTMEGYGEYEPYRKSKEKWRKRLQQ